MSAAGFIVGAVLGTVVTAFTIGLLTAAKDAEEREACPHCGGHGAFVETVAATRRPRPVFCICSLGRAYMEQAATVVDFPAAVKRTHIEWPTGGAS